MKGYEQHRDLLIRLVLLHGRIDKMEHANSMAPFPYYDTDIIRDAKILTMLSNKELSEREPVKFCSLCLSLAVKIVEVNKDNDMDEKEIDYCSCCGQTSISEAHITEWEDMYEEKYGQRFITKK